MLKLQLGLFEQPFVDPAIIPTVLLTDSSRAVALEVARQSMVLLKNDGTLPLAAGTQRIAVIGPLADAKRDMLGAWTLFGQAEDVESIIEGIQATAGEGMSAYLPGCTLKGQEPLDLAGAVALAESADLVIAVLGEGADMSGEARSRANLVLPGRQQELFDALVATGKPVVVVLVTGRPLLLPALFEQANAVLVAWHPGICAGRAVADLLFGAVSPSGRLSLTWPRSVGQIPIYYNHKNTGRPMEGSGVDQFGEPFKSRYTDMPNEPLFPFGYGLGYAPIEYRNLVVQTPTVGRDGTLVVQATVENTGTYTTTEVVQCYIRDLVGSVTRPVKELKGFQRVSLAPGQPTVVEFRIPVADLAFVGPDLQWIVEPGQFHVWIGPHAAEGLQGSFEVRHEAR